MLDKKTADLAAVFYLSMKEMPTAFHPTLRLLSPLVEATSAHG